MDRNGEMNRGLRYMEDIDLGLLAVHRDFASITHERDLASFNKVSNNEIAVPG